MLTELEINTMLLTNLGLAVSVKLVSDFNIILNVHDRCNLQGIHGRIRVSYERVYLVPGFQYLAYPMQKRSTTPWCPLSLKIQMIHWTKLGLVVSFSVCIRFQSNLECIHERIWVWLEKWQDLRQYSYYKDSNIFHIQWKICAQKANEVLKITVRIWCFWLY